MVKKIETVDYVELNKELESILAQFQAGDVDIDEAVRLYERGNQLILQLELHLKTAENIIKKTASIKR